MVYLRWGFWLVFWAIIGGFLHYSLPQRDIVRIVNTYEERQELGDWTRMFWSRPDSQSDALTNRDVQFIQTVRANGRPMVYRNEDTGWSWPPYFKFDTSNLYTEAADAVSTKDDPKWYVLTHYGWRNEFLTVFPNAVHLSEASVEGPDAFKGVPWFNSIFLTVFFAFVYFIWVRWRRFRMARIDPVLDEIEDTWDAAGDQVSETRGRIRRWLDSWRRK